MAGRKKHFDKKARQEHYRSAEISDKLILNLLDIQRTMRSLYEGRGSQRRVLIILRRSGAVTQKELTERLGIQPASVSYVLGRMEGEALIERRSFEGDRRTAEIVLTEKGAAAAAAAAAQRAARHREMFGCLEEDERDELLRLLEKLNADWEMRFGDG